MELLGPGKVGVHGVGPVIHLLFKKHPLLLLPVGKFGVACVHGDILFILSIVAIGEIIHVLLTTGNLGKHGQLVAVKDRWILHLLSGNRETPIVPHLLLIVGLVICLA